MGTGVEAAPLAEGASKAAAPALIGAGESGLGVTAAGLGAAPEIAGAVAPGVAAIENAPVGAITKGLTDAEVAGSAFAPAVVPTTPTGGGGAEGIAPAAGVAPDVPLVPEAPAIAPTTGAPVGAEPVTPTAGTPATPVAPTQAPPPPPVTTTAPTATNLPIGSGGAFDASGLGTGVDAGIPSSDAGLETAKNVQAVQTAAKQAGPSAFTKGLQKIGVLDKEGNIGGNALPLALAGGSALAQKNSGKTLEAQLQKIAAPATQAGQTAQTNAATAQKAAEQLIAQGTSGEVPPAVMQQFEQSHKDKVAEIIQRYANMGRDAKTDSAAQAEINKAKDQMDAQIANYAQQLTSQGLAALSGSTGAAGTAAGTTTPATNAALAGAQQDQEFRQAQASMLQNMALLQALAAGQRVP